MAEKYRHVNFSRAKRGPVIKPEPGKTKISIRLDNAVLEHLTALADKAGGGNYQTLINDALVEHIQKRSHTWELYLDFERFVKALKRRGKL